MSILPSDRTKRSYRICLDACMIALAMILSYVEVLLQVPTWFSLPGFRLGLANIVITVSFCLLSPLDAACISFFRIFLSGLLFGNLTSLYFSALGGLCAYGALFFMSRTATRRCSFVGVSILCAAAHNCGQMLAAVTVFGSALVASYLPALLIASVLYGGAVGFLLNLLMSRRSIQKLRRDPV